VDFALSVAIFMEIGGLMLSHTALNRTGVCPFGQVFDALREASYLSIADRDVANA
jgi:hypothetical protein